MEISIEGSFLEGAIQYSMAPSKRDPSMEISIEGSFLDPFGHISTKRTLVWKFP